jgi:hypothetical protein
MYSYMPASAHLIARAVSVMALPYLPVMVVEYTNPSFSVNGS